MSEVHILDHPLILHKLSLMRDKNTNTKSFRELLTEISMLMGYEVTRNFPTKAIRIETPIREMDAPVLEAEDIVVVPILRAGLGMTDGLLQLMPGNGAVVGGGGVGFCVQYTNVPAGIAFHMETLQKTRTIHALIACAIQDAIQLRQGKGSDLGMFENVDISGPFFLFVGRIAGNKIVVARCDDHRNIQPGQGRTQSGHGLGRVCPVKQIACNE